MSHLLKTTPSGDTHLTIELGTAHETTFITPTLDRENFFTIARLGMYLLALRRQRGLKLAQVSKATGVSTAYLSLIETNGRKSPPGIKILQALATFHGHSLESLLLIGGLQPLPSESTSGDEERIDLNLAFADLAQHPALQTPYLDPEHLKWLAPEVKRAWLAFAVRMFEAARADNPDVHALLQRLRQHTALS